VSAWAGLAASPPVFAADAPPLNWEPWSTDLFARASAQHKFVLLQLGGVQCRWCVTMDAEVYSDPSVRSLLAKAYIPVAADRDQRPDLSNRYPGYDEPMIVMFNTDASEIVELRGFRSADDVASILQAVIADPSPGPSAKQEGPMDYAVKDDFESLGALKKAFDDERATAEGFSAFGIRNVDADAIDYAFELAQRGDTSLVGWAREAVRSARLVLDSASGGAYQSLVIPANRVGAEIHYFRIQLGDRLDDTDASWNEPHRERRLTTQAKGMNIFSEAYGQWQSPADLESAQRIHEFVRRVLTDAGGGFYDAERATPTEHAATVEHLSPTERVNPSRQATPAGSVSSGVRANLPGETTATVSAALDTHVYARENGRMIAALCELYAVSGDETALAEATRAADWILAHRSIDGGGFRHDEADGAGPFLGDTLAMGQAFLALYRVTNDTSWLDRADSALGFMVRTFQLRAGFVTSATPTDPKYQSRPDRLENAELVRFTDLLRRYRAQPSASDVIQRAGRYLTTPDVAKGGLAAPLLRMQVALLRRAPDVIVVGDPTDAQARALFQAALAASLPDRKVEWRTSGNPAAVHAQPAAMLCDGSTCSPPILTPDSLRAALTNGTRVAPDPRVARSNRGAVDPASSDRQ
jgi:uncharacterized protein